MLVSDFLCLFVCSFGCPASLTPCLLVFILYLVALLQAALFISNYCIFYLLSIPHVFSLDSYFRHKRI
ncbi:hypothetical protein B0H13DRAFT_2010229, partial [Mycena leptocephala]